MCGAGLSHEQTLEAPSHFVKTIKKTMEKVLDRTNVETIVERIHAYWDFKEWLAPVEGAITAITIQTHGESVNHGFRFCLRKDLQNYKVHGQDYQWVVQNTNPD